MLMELPDKWGQCSRTIPLEGCPGAFAHWGDVIAVGLGSDVVLLDAVTGIKTSVLSGNPGTVSSLGFSRDGTLLVSKNHYQPVKLWDVQTGGVIRTFDCDTSGCVASISPDGTTIALGTDSGTIHLWDVRTGKLHSIETGQNRSVNHIRFSPVDSHHFISSSSNGTVQRWNVAGQKIGPSYEEGGEDLAYALDGTRFVTCGERVATVRDSESGAVVVEIEAPVSGITCRCCFSADGRFIAFSAGPAIYVWDITIPGARLVARFFGHAYPITSLAFPSYLISASKDKSVKLWPSGSFLAESKSTDHITALQGSTPIESVNLFAKDGAVVTSDESGVVKTWDLTTGRCTSSFSTPAKGSRDTYMAGDAFILVWLEKEDQEQWYHIWDVGKGRLLQRFRGFLQGLYDVKISGDGSKILGVSFQEVEVVSMQTGEITNRLEIKTGYRLRLWVRGSQVGIDNRCREGWDFGGRKVSDFGPLSNQLRLDLANPPPNTGILFSEGPVARWIIDTVTDRLVFRLPERYISRSPEGYIYRSVEICWDGQYLLIWSHSGEVVVVDFYYVLQSLPTGLSAALAKLANLL